MTARRGIPFVVSGPSGVGKSTIVRRVLEADPQIRFSISHTTRAPRAGEKSGVDYFFVDEREFRRMIEAGAFLEYAVYQNHFYGTSRAAVEQPTGHGFDLILEVEMQGAEQLQVRLPHAVRVFIEPPSLDVLETRLRDRRTETEDVLRWRLTRAKEELVYAGQCHHRIVNDSVDKAVEALLQIIREARGERG
ncbi:MAG: guanylate kinase [Myxococcota bacterium]